MKDLELPYAVRLYNTQGDSDAPDLDTARQVAQRRFALMLQDSLGDADMVLPVYQAYQRIAQAYGDPPDLVALTDAEREIAEAWLAAERLAMDAVFGPLRGMGDGDYEILPADGR
ncbi:hypothetical protein ACLBKS_16045 [Hylemonella sp. W303a]|uniref:hypothetical protein n=1 Tax=Hylemonella sp. W303a TaxID=3389873 RepID=UPI00396B0E1E